MSTRERGWATAPIVVTERVGAGRHGQIFRGRRGDHDRVDVALKVLASEHAARHEAAMLDRFRHLRVVELVDTVATTLVLEYLGGGTVQDRLDRGRPLSPGETATMVGHIAAALEPIHFAGWIHGDVNPSNIGLRADGTAVLFDFATAAVADDSPLEEATPEFVGVAARRSPHIDLRALARSAAVCLDPQDPAAASLRVELEAIVARFDRGDPGDPTVLLRVLAPHRRVPIAAARPTTPGRGTTRSFGPRPPCRRHGTAPRRRSDPARSIRLTMLAIGVLTVAATATAAWRFAAVNTARGPAEPIGKTVVVTADRTLKDNGAEWSHSSGVLETHGRERLGVGAGGDLAAIGDWDCDGDATLGVYRPATGEWFTFSGWNRGSRSAPPDLIGRGVGLDIAIDPRGCASPLPRPDRPGDDEPVDS